MSGNILAADAAFWRGDAARSGADDHARADRAFAALRAALLDRAAPVAGERALDIGCGGGTTVLELAARVGPLGHVLGADIAPVAAACVARRIAGVKQAEVLCADVAAHPFAPGSFDLLLSQLGVMFFPEPKAAMMNLHRAASHAGRIAFAVFRAAAENPWPRIATAAVRDLVELPPAVPGTGMFSWADGAEVRGVLTWAGFRDIRLVPVDAPIDLGDTPQEAAEFAMRFGALTRVLPGLAPERVAAVRAALEACFAAQGTSVPGAFQIVLARA